MNILGISCFYHDGAACLVKDGVVVAAAEEERFSRIKHDSRFPIHSIQYCLDQGGLEPADLDYVGFYEKPMVKFERILHSVLDTYPRSMHMFIKAMQVWLHEKLWVPSIIKSQMKYRGTVLYGDHHLSHAASSYLVSPFDEAAILTADGVGEWTTTALGVGRGRDLELTHDIRFPHSLGLLYGALTGYLGFEVNEGEYKVMGMAAYGEPVYYDAIRKLIDVGDDGSFQLNMDYFSYHYRLRALADDFFRLFGPPRPGEAALDQKYADMAASIQRVTEDVLLSSARHLYAQTGLKNLCLAGGVALNCVANARILRETEFDNIYIQPAAGDAGGALGIAMYLYHTALGHERSYVMDSAYLGPGYTNEEIRRFLLREQIPFRELPDEGLLPLVARYLADDNVVGWFQGRMEFGPRALGARSILASPRNPQMKDILNEKIKHREQFRPFAPSVLKEEAPNWFEFVTDSPFMLLVAVVRPEKRALIPAVTHGDNTARLQTVTSERNGRYYDLIREFFRLTGVPAVVNTSFNVRGEPIVCTPEEAFNCFSYTDMDYLVLGNFLIDRSAKKLLGAYAGRLKAHDQDEVLL